MLITYKFLVIINIINYLNQILILPNHFFHLKLLCSPNFNLNYSRNSNVLTEKNVAKHLRQIFLLPANINLLLLNNCFQFHIIKTKEQQFLIELFRRGCCQFFY